MRPLGPALAPIFAVLALLATPARADEIVVFAAASLATALDGVAADFTAATGHEVAISYAGSSQLARQIERGAPAALFLSANSAWMDALEAEARIVADSRRDLLGNRLVLIAHDPGTGAVDLDDPADLATRIGGGPLAMALIDAVPAGIYARAALAALGLWDAVADRVAQADNVRAALALVATGAAPYGVVYATDARAEPRVHVVATFPEASHPPIVYPMALIAGRDGAPARALYDHLATPSSRARFEAQGFAWLGE